MNETQTALGLADLKKMFLFQIRPDLFPGGQLTDVETALWVKYYDNKSQSG